MTTHAAVADSELEQAFPTTADSSGVRSQGVASGSSSQMSNLVNALFLSGAADDLPPSHVIGVTSPIAGEGVSTIAGLVAKDLASTYQIKTLLLTSALLAKLQPGNLGDPESWRRDVANGYWLPSGLLLSQPASADSWQANRAFRSRALSALRSEFGAIVIDTEPATTSGDVATLAPIVDGFLMVVKSGGSSREQLQQALRVIQLSGGTLKGCCLNRQTFPIPDRIAKLFKR